MRIHKRLGLAGLPGISLDGGDFRQFASHFRHRTSGLSGFGSCKACSSGDHSKDIAGAVAETLGLGELADAARDDSIPAPMGQANLLASATLHAMKFKGERVATLSGITNPDFSRKVTQLVGKLKGKMPEDTAYLSALTLCYTNGAIDAAAGRTSPMALGFNRARKQLAKALERSRHPQALAMLAGLGQVVGTVSSYTPATGSGSSTAQGYQQSETAPKTDTTAPKTDVAKYSAWTEPAPVDQIPKGFINPISDVMKTPTTMELTTAGDSDTVYLNSPSYYYPPKRQINKADIGTPLVPPDAVNFVPAQSTVERLIDLWKAGSTLNTTAKAYTASDDDAKRVAAWIYRQMSGDDLRDLFDTWKKSGTENSLGRILYGWLFGVYGLVLVGKSPDNYGQITPAEKRVAELLTNARNAVIGRSGQRGAYVDGQWVASNKLFEGDERVPLTLTEDGAKYIERDYRKLDIEQPLRRILLVAAYYRNAYRKEPTYSALNWYGSFRYGLPDTRALTLSLDQTKKYAERVGLLESVRMAGSAPPPEDLVDNTNVFMAMFSAMGPGLGWILDKINQGVDAAVNALCGFFKTLMGPEVGGVLCAIFTAIIKIVVGGIKASIAAIMSVGKAITGAIGYAAQGKWMEAATAFFVGVNTAVIFLMGGVFADLMGLPFMKAEEKPGGLPSLERLGEELTKDDPLFLVNLVMAVIGVIIGKASPLSIGALLTALSPALAMILAPSLKKALSASKDPSIQKYGNLEIKRIQGAVVSILRLISAVIVGAMQMRGVVAVITEEIKKFVEREGGAGQAVVKSLQFFLENLGSQLTSVVWAIASQPFQMQTLLDSLMNLFTGFLLLIPMFAVNMGFSEGGVSAANALTDRVKSITEYSSRVAENVKENADYGLTLTTPAPPPSGTQTKETVCKALPGEKVIETKIVTNTVVETKTSIPVLAVVGFAALAIGIGLGSTKR